MFANNKDATDNTKQKEGQAQEQEAQEEVAEGVKKVASKTPTTALELLSAIKWHPEIAFANVTVDFHKKKASGKLSKRLTNMPFITFSFSYLDKVDNEQIKKVCLCMVVW